jgi:exonuclease VII small subunit
MKSTEITNIIDTILTEEVKSAITNESGTTKRVKYHVTCEGEPLASFDSVDEAKDYVEKNKDGELKGKKKLLIDKKTYGSYEEMIDHLDEIAQSLEEKESTDLNEMFRQPEMYDNYDDTMDEVKNKVDKWLEMGKIDEQEHYEMMFKIDSEDLDWPTGADENETKHILIQLARECAPHLLKKKKENTNMENQEPMEGNAFVKAMLDAKEKGEKTFEVDGETHDVEECWKQLEEEEGICEECGDMGPINENEEFSSFDDHEKYFNDIAGGLDGTDSEEMSEGAGMCSECGTMLQEDGSCMECSGGMYESKKKKLRLSEEELVKLIGKLVAESIPGLEAVKKSHNQASGQDLKDSVKKIDDYLKFSGNTKPEFPNQEGVEEEKEAYRNTSDEEEFIDTYRGGGLQDLDYDNKPSKEFIDRLRMALEGDPKMGNGQKDTANTTPSNVGKDLFKSIDKEKKTRDADPMYNKDAAPVTEPKKINEDEESSKKVVLEEIDRMKKMANYNKKTQ